MICCPDPVSTTATFGLGQDTVVVVLVFVSCQQVLYTTIMGDLIILLLLSGSSSPSGLRFGLCCFLCGFDHFVVGSDDLVTLLVLSNKEYVDNICFATVDYSPRLDHLLVIVVIIVFATELSLLLPQKRKSSSATFSYPCGNCREGHFGPPQCHLPLLL